MQTPKGPRFVPGDHAQIPKDTAEFAFYGLADTPSHTHHGIWSCALGCRTNAEPESTNMDMTFGPVVGSRACSIRLATAAAAEEAAAATAAAAEASSQENTVLETGWLP